LTVNDQPSKKAMLKKVQTIAGSENWMGFSLFY
jgi:hypothetical protein